ncbi:hypothetical protein E3N88_30842 [Mikania micrantha]|uniref:PB1 domain-containing protein n=1 Tax=Mikania micrantha TaxID=192012 RepID=A0A5N6MNC5_9ASTR|nr:hypothetical protein E3N88_30842 [Mikania micrantha]
MLTRKMMTRVLIIQRNLPKCPSSNFHSVQVLVSLEADMSIRKNSLLLWTSTFFDESRYLTPLQVFGVGEDRSADSTITDLELGVDPNNQQVFEPGASRLIDPDCRKLQERITAALKLLSFREQHVLVQFWSHSVVGNHQLLTTLDQPFGLGVLDVGLRTYRRDSECRSFLVDKDHEADDHSPAARVFRRELPEWTFDLTSYTLKQFPQQACALRCGLHGYLGLPVFDSTTRLCVGVVEILTSSKCTSYAYEVQQLYKAFETVDLRTHQAFDWPTLNVSLDFNLEKNFNKIHNILKTLCDIHALPLAQTWAVSPLTSFVSHEKVLAKICSSFDIKCVGKVCMSRADLPYHVQDLAVWPFLKPCRERHLDRSCGLVGRALLTRGSCFCANVTKLSEEEYPLVHNARMNGLTSCFAIYLHSVESGDDYVLEFFLPPNIKESRHVLNLVQTLKQTIDLDSGFELGDASCIHVVEPPTEVDNATNSGEKSNSSKLGRKRKMDSLTMDAVEKHVGKPIFQAAKSLGVGRSTLKRFCREHNMPSWPFPKHSIKASHITNLKPSQKAPQKQNLQQSSKKHFGLFFVVFLMVSVKRWSCSRKRHGFSGKWWRCGRHSYLPSRSNSMYHTALLIIRLRRWRKKTSKRNTMHKSVSESTAKSKYTINFKKPNSRVAEPSLVHAFPKKTVANISNKKMVTVKATFRNDMIKFQFPASSGLLKLKNEVAQRIKLESRRLRLKYKDEDSDLILLASDDDLRFLLGFTANNELLSGSSSSVFRLPHLSAEIRIKFKSFLGRRLPQSSATRRRLKGGGRRRSEKEEIERNSFVGNGIYGDGIFVEAELWEKNTVRRSLTETMMIVESL